MNNQNMDNSKCKGNENERRVDHLVNLVERKTRTERHLEEHSDISSSPENLEHAKELNQKRENEIQDIKNILSHGENYNNDTIANTEKRFRYAEGYLNHNKDHMDNKSFTNAKERQENRKRQLDQMK